MDVKSAFLNDELQEEVYITQPPGFIIVREESKVVCLSEVLYGLCQAPRTWIGVPHVECLCVCVDRCSSMGSGLPLLAVEV
jgi:hypothetical protein